MTSPAGTFQCIIFDYLNASAFTVYFLNENWLENYEKGELLFFAGGSESALDSAGVVALVLHVSYLYLSGLVSLSSQLLPQ